MTDMAESIEAFGKLQNIYHGASGAAGRHLLLLHFSPWWQVHVLNCPCQWVCLDHFPEPGYTIIKVCILLKIPLPLAPSNQATRKSSVIHDWVGVGECTWMWICAFVCSCSSRRCSNLQLTSLSQCNVVNPRIGSSQLRVE